MILSTHALVGAAIGENIRNPWLIIILSVIIHFVLDGFRHGEYFDSRREKPKDFAWKVSIDIFVSGSIILFFLFYSQAEKAQVFLVLLGVFFSVLPDFFTVLYWFHKNKILSAIKKFHELAHRYDRFPKFSLERKWNLRNARNDIIISLLAILILFL